jgi:two-component system, cell cycle sensor histidine kinase and response regulator CckA
MSAERILIVDDDELVRSGLALDLQGEGYEVVTAGSAEEALRILEESQVHVLLSDLVMEGMGGMALLEHVSACMPDVALVVITGHGTVDRAVEAVRCGAHDFIQKPADPGAIRRCVRSVLDGARLQRTLREQRRAQLDRQKEHQRRLLRDQRMLSLARLADGVSDYLADAMDPILRHGPDLLRALPDGHPLREQTHELARAKRKVEALIQDLHAIGTGPSPGAGTVALATVLQAVLAGPAVARQLRDPERIKLTTEVAPDLPAVRGSTEQVRVVLGNLIGHVLEGLSAGGRVAIQVGTEELPASDLEPGGRFVVLRIDDDAPAPPVKDIEKLFEPFQVRRIGDRAVSTGIGLSVVYRLLAVQGGFIDARYQPGEGTRYLVYLPVEGAVAAAGPVAAGGTQTVLVLDDDATHRGHLVAILEQSGYRVLTATSGEQALLLFRDLRQSARRRPIDLALLDLVLGEALDGVEVYRRILEQRPGQRAILMSGFASSRRIDEARALGLRHHLQKPCAPDELITAVRQALEHG